MSVELYDPVANPFAPGAGTPPPALVGRDDILAATDVALQRLRSQRSTQHQLITGLRGVGKTVLLAKLAGLAQRHGFRVIRIEASDDDTIGSLVHQARRIIDDLEPSGKVDRALRSIESVTVTLLGSGIAMERGTTPAAAPEALAEVISDLAAAAADNDLGVLVAIDEAQIVPPHDLRRILAGVHRCSQDQLPLACVLAGLPNLIGIVAKAATYAERMFTVAELGPLTPDQVSTAITEPSQQIGVTWDPSAIGSIVERSDGYPFFVQTWAHYAWNTATDDPISVADTDRAAPHAEHALASAFFAARIARIPASEIAYVRALASLGPGPHRSGAVAAAADKTTSQVAPFRDRLITEGVIYAPRYGWVEFAIPHFDRYIQTTLA